MCNFFEKMSWCWGFLSYTSCTLCIVDVLSRHNIQGNVLELRVCCWFIYGRKEKEKKLWEIAGFLVIVFFCKRIVKNERDRVSFQLFYPMIYSNKSFKSLKPCLFLCVKHIFQMCHEFLSHEIRHFYAPVTQKPLTFGQSNFM